MGRTRLASASPAQAACSLLESTHALGTHQAQQQLNLLSSAGLAVRLPMGGPSKRGLGQGSVQVFSFNPSLCCLKLLGWAAVHPTQTWLLLP